ncbi:MAG: LD-carboxypeptidase [Saprospiraceae bacterium]|nr:LD-carboxypeptidase [Saprospiraceae bacterium]
MTRRDFHQLLSIGAMGYIANLMEPKIRMIKPKMLKTGDQIALIAPGSSVPPEKIEQAVVTCRSLGLEPVVSQYAMASNGYLAGTDEQRLEDLHSMFLHPDIKGIWCLRGGYGCTRLLPHINFELIRQNPKVFIGYSDITALHLAIGIHCNLVTFHGPVASSNATDYTIERFKEVIMKPGPLAIQSTEEASALQYVIRDGSAEGSLTGGNLSLLTAMVGTPWLPGFAHKIVCIEDIGEKPYRIDRMLVQLFQATDLDKAAGIILGQFKDCEAKPEEKSFSLEETLRHQFKDISAPVFYGFSFGHIDEQCTLPLGQQAKFNTQDKILHLLESPTNL